MNIEQLISQAEQRLADLEKVSTDQSRLEIVETEKELLRLYRQREAASRQEPPDDSRQRSLFAEACVRLGCDAIAAQAFFAPRAPAQLIVISNGNWQWHSGQSIVEGLRSELPVELQDNATNRYVHTPAGALKQKLEQAKVELANAKQQVLKNISSDAHLSLLSRAKAKVANLEQQIAELEPKQPESPRQLTPAQHAHLSRLRNQYELQRKGALANPQDQNQLIEMSKAKRELKMFTESLAIN